jgi:hypothetical protein
VTKKKSQEITNNRLARDSSRADTCPVDSSTRLPTQDSSGGAAYHRLGAALGAAPASRRRSASGAPRVTGLGQLWGRHVSHSLQHLPLSAGQLRGHRVSSQLWVGGKTLGRVAQKQSSRCFFSTRRSAQDISGGSACPRGSGPNEDRRADAEDLAEPGRCKAKPIRSKRNRAQGAAADSYRINPDPICGGPIVVNQKAAAARLRDNDGGGRVAPRRGDEKEMPVEARTSDDEDRRQN